MSNSTRKIKISLRKIRNRVKRKFRWCGYFGCTKRGKRRAQNTQYCDYESNFVCACDEHFEEIESYWNERWEEYWAGRL